MVNVVDIALDLGCLSILNLYVGLDEIDRLPKEKVVIITTLESG